MKTGDMKITLFFGLGVLAVAVAILIWQRAVQRWIQSDVLEGSAYETVQRINLLDNHLIMAESQQRDHAMSVLGKNLRLLRQLIDEDVRQQARWELLEKLLSQRLAQLQGHVPTDTKTSEQLRGLLRSIGHEENLRLHQRIEQKQTQMFNTVKAVTAILIGGTVLFFCVFWLLRREIIARREAEARTREEHAALEKAMRDLAQSHWHLDKVAEFLPICMECGKVKTADTHWESIIDYFRKNELLFTHGYCPACAAQVRAKYEQEKKQKKLDISS